MNLNENISIGQYKEIQRRYTEKVTITVNKGKDSERQEVVTDLPEPSFKEWRFTTTNKDGLGHVLISKCSYGESRSETKKKLYASESWTIICDCKDKGQFGLSCEHKNDIAKLNFDNVSGWNPVLQEYLDQEEIRDSIIFDGIRSLPEEIIKPYTKYTNLVNIKGKEKAIEKDLISKEIKKLGFSGFDQLINFILYFSLNKSMNANRIIKIDINEISTYLKSPKFKNFIELKQIVDIRLEEESRFDLLNKKLKKLENRINDDNSDEYKIMKEIELDYWNFGNDINSHYK